MSSLDVFDIFSRDYARERFETMSLRDWLLAARDDKMFYATPPERMVAAIGEAELVDTAQDPRLARLFSNRTIKTYKAFEGFFGMEDTLERIVGYFKHAAQGLEEKRQILYLLGPVGGGKSSLAERLKDLMEKHPIYVLKAGDVISPVFESPLGLFRSAELGNLLAERYGIERHRVGGVMSPWAVKRLDEFGGDISKFEVAKILPSKLRQYAIAKTEPGDENNQDISALVGKVDIRKLEHFSQNDPDAYSFSGGLCRSNQGLLEFVEMFKAPIKVLHPLLTATQEGNYIGTETLGPIPFNGTILAHSNEAEWTVFKNNRNNEAFLDRICVVTVPYCLRVTEETAIYKKLLVGSNLGAASTAPETLEMLAKFCVATRLKEHENSNVTSKMRVYDGEKLKDTDPKAKTLQEYKDMAGVDEGMTGISTRFALRLQDAVGDLQLRPLRGRGRSGASDVRAGTGDQARADARRDEKNISNSSRRSSRRATPSSSARRSRRPIWNPTANTARTCSTATSPTPMRGSRTRTTRTPTRASCSTAPRSTTNSPRSRSRPASPTRRISATRW